jgi:hypothetical protein
MLLYVAAMKQFLSVPTNRTIPNLKGHVDSLQRIRNLTKEPKGRWLDPYEQQNIIPNFEGTSGVSSGTGHERR